MAEFYKVMSDGDKFDYMSSQEFKLCDFAKNGLKEVLIYFLEVHNYFYLSLKPFSNTISESFLQFTLCPDDECPALFERHLHQGIHVLRIRLTAEDKIFHFTHCEVKGIWTKVIRKDAEREIQRMNRYFP